MPEIDPTIVTCPHCDAPVAFPCSTPKGAILPPDKTHAKRRAAAAESMRELEQVDAAEDNLSTERALKLYRSIVATLELRNDLEPWTRLLAFRVAQNTEEADTHKQTAMATPVVSGSTGQLAVHPLWRLAIALEDRALNDLKALRLTPDAAGWVKGDTAAPQDDLDDLDQAATQPSSKKKRGRG